MDWNEIGNAVFQLVLLPLLGLALTYFKKWVNLKIQEAQTASDNDTLDRYLGMLDQTISDCVTETNQTYVEEMKDKNAFDVEAQKKAFKMTFDNVLKILGEDAIEYLKAAVGDLEALITSKIETEVNMQK